jgi:hypothetical protein
MGNRDSAFSLSVIATAFVFYLLAYFAPLSSADAGIFLLLVAFTGQRIRPFLLILAASVQDAPGCSYLWSYVGFTGVGSLLVLDYIVRRSIGREVRRDLTLERLVTVALIVVLYAIAVSALQAKLGGYEQASSRPFLMVGGLMLLMILCGYVSSSVVGSNAGDWQRIGGLAALSAVHALIVGLAQIPFGQSIYRSGTRLAEVELSNQLVEAGAIGFARINGPFMSPNAFGFTILLLGLFLTVTMWAKYPRRILLFYAILGAAAVLLSMSKALLGYYVLSMLVLICFAFGGVAVFLAVLVGAIGIYLLLPGEFWQLIFDIFRFQEGTLGSRQWSWLAVANELSLADWIFGIGLSAWPVFFEQKIGIPLSDPHSVLLSIPGTFGLIGILFYLMLLALLAMRFSHDEPEARRLGVVLLVLLFFGKDLVSIPVVLGNTQLTFMIWLLIGLTLGKLGNPWSSNRAQVAVMDFGSAAAGR